MHREPLRTLTPNLILIDSIGVAQNFVDGLIVRPNDLIDEHLLIEVFNND